MPKRSAENDDAALATSIRKELGKASEGSMALKALKKAVGSELEKSEFKKAVKQAAKAEGAGFTVEGKEVKLAPREAEKPAKKVKKETKAAAAAEEEEEEEEEARGVTGEASPEIQVPTSTPTFCPCLS
jgi:TPP-dependent indolepyruvate ferredoxin oxidoreductase alpha subunit